MERGELQKLLDPNLKENYDKEQVRRVVEAASLCLRRSARLRPRMNEVTEARRARVSPETDI